MRTAARTGSRPEGPARGAAPSGPSRRAAVGLVAWLRSECSRLEVPIGAMTVGDAFAWITLALPAQHGQVQNAFLAELAGLKLTHDLPGAHDQDPIAHGDHLWKL